MQNNDCLLFQVIIPKNPKVEHKKYHGYTYVRGTPNCHSARWKAESALNKVHGRGVVWSHVVKECS